MFDCSYRKVMSRINRRRKLTLDRRTFSSIKEIVRKVNKKKHSDELELLRTGLYGPECMSDYSLCHLNLYTKLYNSLKYKLTTAESLAYISLIDNYCDRWDLKDILKMDWEETKCMK